MDKPTGLGNCVQPTSKMSYPASKIGQNPWFLGPFFTTHLGSENFQIVRYPKNAGFGRMHGHEYERYEPYMDIRIIWVFQFESRTWIKPIQTILGSLVFRQPMTTPIKALQKYDCVQANRLRVFSVTLSQSHWLASSEDANINAYTGWWFGTWLLWLSIYWECHHPNWRTTSFFRGVGQPPTRYRFDAHDMPMIFFKNP